MIKTIKDLIADKLLQSNLKASVGTNKSCPVYYEKLTESGTQLDTILDISKIPSFSYLEETSASSFNERLDAIKSWIRLSAQSLKPIVLEYKDLTSKYENIATRIFNESEIFRNQISKMLNQSCYFIDTAMSNQTANSNCGIIGKYVTLPFFIASTRMLNDFVSIRVSSTGQIVYSNAETVGYIPLPEWIALKVSGNKQETVTINVVPQETKSCNAFYLKMLNSVIGIDVSFYKDSTLVYRKSYSDNEIFDNFQPIEFNNFVISIRYNNPNTDKPFAVQISKLEIFESILFSRTGFFESKQINISSIGDVTNVGIVYTNDGDANNTKARNLISISQDPNVRDYNILEEDGSVDISVHKYRHSKYFDQFEVDFNNEVTLVTPEGMENKALFFRWQIDKNAYPELWSMDYRNALMFHGLPTEYSKTTQSYKPSGDVIYENWTKVENYWKTMIIVYEDNVTIDLGQSSCIINGKERTGKVVMPKGISSIEVHEKNIDFKFGKVTSDFLDVTNQTTIYDDPLFPFNFAYMFTGLPDFTQDGSLEETVDRSYPVSDTSASTIVLGESFLPFSMKITDSAGSSYGLVLTKGVSQRGTFSVEPYSGKIKIYPKIGATSINVEYIRANPFRRPIGVTFNRLLTYMPIKALLGLTWSDAYTFFTLDGSPSERALLVQKLPEKQIVHSQIIFNTLDDNAYASVKIDLETANKYLTPIISNIFLNMG